MTMQIASAPGGRRAASADRAIPSATEVGHATWRDRSVAPLHPQLVARAMGSAAMRIAAALELQGEQAAGAGELV